MLARLVRDPRWLAGSLGDTAAFAMQAVALGFGSLLLVQPLIVTQLVFALPLAAWWAGRRPSAGSWRGPRCWLWRWCCS